MIVTKDKTLPDVMTSPETGERLTRGVRPFAVAYKGEQVVVDLPGYYPVGDGDGVHVGKDMEAADQALRSLKEKIDGLPSPATIRHIRAKLKLTRNEAGLVLKVGRNAFGKYESGEIAPSGPMAQLLTLLDRHPHLIKELRPEAGSRIKRSATSRSTSRFAKNKPGGSKQVGT